MENRPEFWLFPRGWYIIIVEETSITVEVVYVYYAVFWYCCIVVDVEARWLYYAVLACGRKPNGTVSFHRLWWHGFAFKRLFAGAILNPTTNSFHVSSK